MIKNITAIVSANKDAVAKKAIVFGTAVIGLAVGALLVNKPETTVIIGETVTEETVTEHSTPEAPAE